MAGSLFSLQVKISLGLGSSDARPLVVLRGVRLEVRFANRNMWSLSSTIFTQREGKDRRKRGSEWTRQE